jgi:RNA polymerase sigma-70 factor, ECF subfamily
MITNTANVGNEFALGHPATPATTQLRSEAEASNAVLIEGIAAGDTRSMRSLYTRHSVAVFRFVMRLTKDRSLSEDVVSDVFLDVWRTAGSFQARSTVSTWLLGIARNKISSKFRRRSETQLDEQFAEAIEDTADDPEQTLAKTARNALLHRCITKLSPAHREIIDLVYYHEKSVQEVAQITGIPTGTVKTRMHHARNRLATLLKELETTRRGVDYTLSTRRKTASAIAAHRLI